MKLASLPSLILPSKRPRREESEADALAQLDQELAHERGVVWRAGERQHGRQEDARERRELLAVAVLED
mgnify:CR=1 FL=1